MHVLARAIGAVTVLCALSGSQAAFAADAPPGHTIGSDGTTSPIYPMADAKLEHVYVQTKMDSDHDGKKDLVRADISRPTTPAGVTIPAIITASGYNGTPPQLSYVDDQNSDTSDLASMSGVYDNYFVPRGYAYVSVDVAGTNWSEGCVDDVGPNDVGSVAAVIRWLHHEEGSIAYRNLDRAATVDSSWSDGNSALTGISYDGGITNAVATSRNAPGLKTIVPIAGGTSAYNTRSYGVYVGGGTADFSEWLTNPEPKDEGATLPAKLRAHQAVKIKQCQASFDAMRAQSDPTDRTYNAFWKARNFSTSARVSQIAKNGISVFDVIGQGDTIVRQNEFDQHWALMQRAGVRTKLWMHLRGHIDPFEADRAEWISTLHRWYDSQLLGIDNGITAEPPVRIETTADRWDTYSSWPVQGSTKVPVLFSGATGSSAGTLSTTVAPGAATSRYASFTGGQLADATPFGLTDGKSGLATGPDRLAYVSAPLTRDVHLSGTPTISLRVKASVADTNISAAIVDLGTGTSVDWDTDDRGVQELATSHAWGEPTADDGTTLPDTAALTKKTDGVTVSRGTLNTAHYQSVEKYTPAPTTGYVRMTWNLFALDHIVPAGHRIGVVLFNNSTVYDGRTVGNYVGIAGSSVDTLGSGLLLPVVGGRSAIG